MLLDTPFFVSAGTKFALANKSAAKSTLALIFHSRKLLTNTTPNWMVFSATMVSSNAKERSKFRKHLFKNSN